MKQNIYLKSFSKICEEKVALFADKDIRKLFFYNKTNIRVTEGLQINNIISKKCSQNKNKQIKCLEIGCGTGGSTFSMIAGNKNLILDSVDISTDSIDITMAAILSKAETFPEVLNVTFHNSDSLDFLDSAIDKKIIYDFVLVDGSHKYSHVCKEVKKIMKVTNSKSFLFFDDSYKSCETSKGVNDGIKENISKRKFLEGHYIGKDYYDSIRNREISIFNHDIRDIDRIKGVWKHYINHPDRWFAKDASPYHFIQCFPGRSFKWV